MTTIRDALDDKHLFRPHLRGDPQNWRAWRSFLAAVFGLPMSDEEAAIFRACTGRTELPTAPAEEIWAICGRRAGKSFTLALIATFLASFRSYAAHLAPGERPTVMVIAADKRQARVIFRYVKALITETPLLKGMIERETAECLDLSNGTTIEISAASYKSVRGYTLIAALCDEIAFWPAEDSANPDEETLAALRPALATLPGVLLCASSPYSRRGALWEAWRQHYGRDNDSILVWRAPTRTMNPTVKQSIIDAALERDPASASAEFLAQFRTDVERVRTREAVEACVSPGCYERPRVAGVTYQAFVDPSGGSSDSMTIAIGHREGERAVLDAIRERKPPFSPESVVSEFSDVLKRYGVHVVKGDRYGGEWPREAFRRHNITYEPAERPKSEIYLALIPTINSGRADLLDNDRLVAQLVGLERRTSRGGRDSIDHAPGGHDDLANAAAGVLADTVLHYRRSIMECL